MTCRELLQRFKEALERDELNVELLRKLVNKCGAFGVEAFKAFARKIAQFAAAQAWGYYRGR
jgi:Xaa-Pro aminopeptidase